MSIKEVRVDKEEFDSNSLCGKPMIPNNNTNTKTITNKKASKALKIQIDAIDLVSNQLSNENINQIAQQSILQIDTKKLSPRIDCRKRSIVIQKNLPTAQ